MKNIKNEVLRDAQKGGRNKMKSKYMALPVLLLLFAGLVAVVEAGTCTFVSPTTDSTLGKVTQKFNITTTTATVRNCTVLATSALSGESKSFVLKNITKTGYKTANATVATGAWKDAGDYAMSVTCVSVAGATVDTCSASGINIDHGLARVTSCSHVGVTAVNGTSTDSSTNTVSCTVKNATTCYMYWQDSTADEMGDDSSDVSCTYSSTSSYAAAGTSASCELFSANDGRNTWIIRCDDGVNTTSTGAFYFTLDGYSEDNEEDGNTYVTTYFKDMKNSYMFLAMAGVVMLMLLGAGVYFMNKKK